MEFIAKIIESDRQLLVLINSFHNGFFDTFMFTFSKVAVWIPFYLSVVFILFKNEGKKALWLVLLLIAGVVLADQISVLIKDSVQRFRPSHDPVLSGFVHIVRNSRAGMYGFVSSHAANTVGFAILSSLFVRRKSYLISVLSWAFITCYSRIYLGLHYPLDILGGALTGTLIALFLYFVYKKYLSKTANVKPMSFEKIPSVILLVTVAGIALFSAIR